MKIDIQSLQKVFGKKTAVDIQRFQVNHGDILGLVGNNGAGKTTLFRLILDLLKAESGRVLLTPSASAHNIDHQASLPSSNGGEDLAADIAPDASAIDPAASEEWKPLSGAYIDDGFLIDFLTPEEYIDFIAKVNGMQRIDWAHLDSPDCPIAPFLAFTHGEIFGQKKLIRDFSAGNKQKVGIIAALFTRPELLILDEPFNFLDPSGQNILKKLLTDYNASTHATILISSHNLQHTVDISTRVALMENGHIIKDINNDDRKAGKQLEEYFMA